MVLPYSRNLAYTYDSLNRPVSKTLSGGTADISESYTYLAGAGTNTTTPLVSRITYSDGKYLQYSYDALNNISAVVDSNGGKRTTYSYDGLGQLIRENNPYTNKSYVYAYDKGGNITSVTTYAYTTGTLGTVTSTVTYTYGDTAWKDKLTSYNGTAITYDSIGNPLSYRNGTLAWAGRQLKSHTSTSGTTTIYTYNSDGVRIGKKSVYQGNTSETSYVVSGTQILSETKGTSTIYYIYDDKGLPLGLVYNGTTYTYRKNIQGDIIGILDGSGAEVVTYTYNAWGVATVGGSLSSTLGAKNPFRYRGYYYDTETGYYYLNSRYYDPTTGRFLNPEPNVDIGGFDSGAGLLGYNVYAYCRNNPVNFVDFSGEWTVSVFTLTHEQLTAYNGKLSEFKDKQGNPFVKFFAELSGVVVSCIPQVPFPVGASISVVQYFAGLIPSYRDELNAIEKLVTEKILPIYYGEDYHFRFTLLLGSHNNQLEITVLKKECMRLRVFDKIAILKYYRRVETFQMECLYSNLFDLQTIAQNINASISTYSVETGYTLFK